HVPEWAKDFAIQVFGTYDKVALQVGTIIILLAVAALIGVLGALRLWWGLLGVVAFGVIGLLSALSRTGSTGAWVIPSIVAAVAAGLLLWLLLRLAPKEAPDETQIKEPSKAYFG